MSAPTPSTVSDTSSNQNNTTPVSNDWSYLRVQMVECDYKWTIDNFSLRQEQTGNVLISPTFFSANSDDQSNWSLLLYPRGDNAERKDSISVFLKLNSCNTPEIRAKFKVSIINAKDEETKTVNSRWHRFVIGGNWGGLELVKRDFLLTNAVRLLLLPDNKLTIFCEVTAIKDYEDISDSSNLFRFHVSEYKLLEDMSSLFENQKFHDVVLSAGGKDFHVHKAVLVARSPVFAAMFEHEMEEKKENRVVISDICPEVLEEMLRYMYTGKTENIRKLAEGLLPTADKYDLRVLKEKCDKELCSCLTVNNAVTLLILADLYNAEKLKAEAINFIITHASDVMDTAEWKSMILTHPHLIAEAFRAIAT